VIPLGIPMLAEAAATAGTAAAMPVPTLAVAMPGAEAMEVIRPVACKLLDMLFSITLG